MSRKEKTKCIEAAKQVLISLGLPRTQQNERSALCLLALLNLTPEKGWYDAENMLIGITPIMEWARKHYDKEYAPNTRETVRRQTMHQFVQAGLVLYNPDKPDRPVNSPQRPFIKLTRRRSFYCVPSVRRRGMRIWPRIWRKGQLWWRSMPKSESSISYRSKFRRISKSR